MISDRLTKTLVAAEAVLFDFDGPLCHVFGGVPAPEVAVGLSRLVAESDPELWAKLEGVSDPLEVLSMTYDFNRSLSDKVETALIAAEIEAVDAAGEPTSGAVEALTAVREFGRRIGVVTNNSVECARRYLDRHELSDFVDVVVGRTPHRPDLMKPSPHALLRAAEVLDVSPEGCVLIGDSVTDVQAAHAAGGTAIGYANKPRKLRTLAEAGAEAIMEDMATIAGALS
ncbi:HAD family hydrolase [Streptomyces sp. NPDC055186]